MPGACGSGCGPVAGSVLVVEDEREIRELLRRYLERAGLPVLTAAGGAEAIRMLNEGAARLVLLDLGLPDVDGEEVLRAARAAGEVPVVVLTATGPAGTGRSRARPATEAAACASTRTGTRRHSTAGRWT